MSAVVQFYFSSIVLMLPLLFCAGIGVYWGKRDLPFGGSFITMLVTCLVMVVMVLVMIRMERHMRGMSQNSGNKS